MRRLNLYRQVDNIFTEPWDAGGYSIYKEITCYEPLTDEELKHLIKVGIEAYSDLDQSTSTGIGNTILNLLFNNHNALSITVKDIIDAWECGEVT